MKSVAIYGFAPQTRDFVNESDADEVWSLNNFYNYGLDEARVTRTFEMHELWTHYVYSMRENAGSIRYWEWLKEPHPFKIYMAKVKRDFVDQFRVVKKRFETEDLNEHERMELGMKLKEIEIAYDFFSTTKSEITRYPLEDICREFFPEIQGIDTERFPSSGVLPYFVSSIDYMSALAIYEGFDRIEYYGIELREKTEWAMQKSGATYWIGVAQGRGIEVLVPRNSVLIKAPLYGIESGAQMIPIQVPEELKRLLGLEFDRQRNLHNHYTGKFTTLKDLLTKYTEEGKAEDAELVQKEMDAVQKDADASIVKMYLAEGGMNAMAHLIKNENLELDPITLESITRLEYIEEDEPESVPA